METGPIRHAYSMGDVQINLALISEEAKVLQQLATPEVMRQMQRAMKVSWGVGRTQQHSVQDKCMLSNGCS